jgi:hypothetical protein
MTAAAKVGAVKAVKETKAAKVTVETAAAHAK